ncbi:triose-phosphate isomerase [Nitratifractor salsuginis]|uniref:Triosephosphate isomerase n=1 Tax=Nitratifractor salsuginis (strain DSM 16511 / JCM 12458 / E9I37-1) TaxID=749222 RepID=E6WZ10_NITSE|nr:triose-phosphate isomerase [Nitratifractor salsuginis]ADV45460.1 triosephosphate isomerase [Nitratifractor salsuginis DSM 16511]
MIFAANFKMHHTRQSTTEYLDRLEALLERAEYPFKVMVFPPATALQPSREWITVGAQNAYPAEEGAYTGEIGLSQLHEFEIDTVLIGHSERRQILGEDQEFIAKKFAFYREHGFQIIYCVGEPLEVREQGFEAVAEYLWEQFDDIDIDYERLIVAYEPVWAIGTGQAAEPEAIAATHAELRRRIKRPILYGGSVNPTNIARIAEIPDVDGVLVGSASLDPEKFHALMIPVAPPQV